MNKIHHSHIHRLRTRTHVTVACTNCRRLKRRCSGEPVCTNCANRSFECIFVRSGKKRGRKSQKPPYTNGSDVSAHEHPSAPNMNNDNNGTFFPVSQNVQGHLTIDPFQFIRNNDRQTPNENLTYGIDGINVADGHPTQYGFCTDYIMMNINEHRDL